jgi:hypothetical protein
MPKVFSCSREWYNFVLKERAKKAHYYGRDDKVEIQDVALICLGYVFTIPVDLISLPLSITADCINGDSCCQQTDGCCKEIREACDPPPSPTRPSGLKFYEIVLPDKRGRN